MEDLPRLLPPQSITATNILADLTHSIYPSIAKVSLAGPGPTETGHIAQDATPTRVLKNAIDRCQRSGGTGEKPQSCPGTDDPAPGNASPVLYPRVGPR